MAEPKPRLDAEWHAAHRMPRNATLGERVAWHEEHARVCGCRGVPASIAREIDRREREAGG
jgi:hypothetical protein